MRRRCARVLVRCIGANIDIVRSLLVLTDILNGNEIRWTQTRRNGVHYDSEQLPPRTSPRALLSIGGAMAKRI
jgi:hypothetical protein